MIENFTTAEWEALTSAVVLLEADLEQNPENYRHTRPTGTQIQAALQRAYRKAQQLAPVTQEETR